MIAAHADGYRVLKDDRYRMAADRAADFLWGTLRTPEGRLLRTHRAGRSKLNGYLEDYAFFAHGLLRLHAATGDPNRLAQARALVDRMIADFSDAKSGGFFDTSDDHETLLSRPKSAYDNALPAGNSLAIRDLVALHAPTGEPRYLDLAGRALDAFSSTLARSPSGAPLMLVALHEYLDAREPNSRPPSIPAPEPDDADASLTPRSVLTARALTDVAASPGSEVVIPLDLRVQAGWHIYANPTRSSTAPPTLLTLNGVDAALASVEYPPGLVKTLAGAGSEPVSVYEGPVRLTARVKLPADAKPGPLNLSFKVRYQACNDRACLAPATLTVPAHLDVKSR